MSAKANKSTDLPVKVGLNLNLKSRPLPVVITVIIVAVILALVVLAVFNLLTESTAPPEPSATASMPDSQVAPADPAGQITYPIDINTADVDTLALLPGIGSARASAIVEYRNTNGAFTSIEDIQNVYGIGQGLFERIKDRIKV